jgi:CHAT domain-containing protein
MTRGNLPLALLAWLAWSGAAHASPPTLAAADAVRSLLDHGHYADAESLAWRLEDSARSRPGADSLEYARTLDLLVESLWRNGHAYHATARGLAERAEAIRERRFGSSSAELARPLLAEARVLDDRNESEESMRLVRRAIALLERSSPCDSLLLAQALGDLGVMDSSVPNLAEADSAIAVAYGIRDRHLPADDPDRAAGLVELSITIWARGEPREAIRMLEDAVSMFERTLGPDHPRLGRVLYLLALRQRFVHDAAGTRRNFERSIAILERSLRPDHPTIASALFFAAPVWHGAGDPEGAGRMLERARSIRERELPPQDPDRIWSIEALGEWRFQRGDFAKGRALLEDALRMQRRFLPKGALQIGITLRVLGGLRICVGEYREGRDCLVESDSIFRAHFQEGNPDVMWSRYHVAEADLFNGDFAACARTVRDELPHAMRGVGADDALISHLYSLLGFADAGLGRWTEARRVLLQSLHMRERQYGPRDPVTLMARLEAARVLSAMGRHAEAEALLTGAVAAADTCRAFQGWPSAYSHLLLADVRSRSGDVGPALEEALDAHTRMHAILLANLGYLSEAQGLRVLDLSARAMALVLELASVSRVASPALERRAYEAVIQARGMVLDEASSRLRAGRFGSDPIVASIESSLVVESARVANLEIAVTSIGASGDMKMLDAARRERSALEQRLAEREGALPNTEAATLARVTRALPPSTALVSYACYERPRIAEEAALGIPGFLPHRAGPAEYVAFVLRPPDRTPLVIPIGPAARIDSLVVAYAAEVSRPVLLRDEAPARERLDRELGDRLRRAVWDPIARHLSRSGQAFVVLDGELQMMNLASLPAAGGGYLVEHGPALHYLNAERDLITDDAAGTRGRGLLAVGDPDFDARASFSTTPATVDRHEGDTRARSGTPARRGGTIACEGFREVHFSPLPDTRQEIQAIRLLWDRVNRGAPPRSDVATIAADREPLELLSGSAATKRAFEQRAPGHRILHVATHGFFYVGGCASEWPGLRGIGLLVPVDAVHARWPSESAPSENEHDPLLLSGLALAGANRRQEAGPDEDNGILTAEEIAVLDLSGVEWVVVSACQSGAGAIRNGEGVFGLKRSFQKAGARTTILSLWEVEDRAAREWMGALYEARLQRGLSTVDATRAASVSVLRARRARGETTHPFFWGGFVASGDWR